MIATERVYCAFCGASLTQAVSDEAHQYPEQVCTRDGAGDPDDAPTECGQAPRLAPNWGEAHDLHGVIPKEQGRVEEGIPSGEVARVAPVAGERQQWPPAWSTKPIGADEMVRPPRGVPRWPPGVALLNLTGLGAGYLYMQDWLRWLIHFLVVAVLIGLAFLTNGSYAPGLWISLFAVALLWIAFDGWRQAHRLTRAVPDAASGRKWLSMVVGVVIIGLEIGGFIGYVTLGSREFVAGLKAYYAPDCRTAMQHLNRVTTVYELMLSSSVRAADARIVECSLLLYADNSRAGGRYADAVASYETYLDLYPKSSLIRETQWAVAETLTEWAMESRREGRYETAIEKCLIATDSYPSTPAGREAAALAAETYVEWADELRRAGDYAASTGACLTVLTEYPGMPAGKDALVLVAETYYEWAGDLREGSAYAEAVEKYEIVQEQYPDTPSAEEALETAAETYAEWAAQLHETGEYEAAIEKYQVVLDEYADASAAAGVEEEIAQAYADWAAELRQAGHYEAAIERYQVLIDEYGDTPAAVAVEGKIASSYAEWAAQLRAVGKYTAAIGKYETIIGKYPESDAAQMAPVAMGQTYNDWGKEQHSQEEYISALAKFTKAQEVTEDSDVIAAAQEGYDEALWDLSQTSTGDGRKVLDEAREAVCGGKSVSSSAVGLAKDEAGKALLCGSPGFSLPSDLKAVKPGHFRYVVYVEEESTVVQRCNYTRLGCYGWGCPVLHVLVRRKYQWDVTVHDTSTPDMVAQTTLYGSLPRACSSTENFGGTYEKSIYGSPPPYDVVIDWLRGVVR